MIRDAFLLDSKRISISRFNSYNDWTSRTMCLWCEGRQNCFFAHSLVLNAKIALSLIYDERTSASRSTDSFGNSDIVFA